MFRITPPVGVATNIGAIVLENFPKDPVVSKFRILGCKIEGVA